MSTDSAVLIQWLLNGSAEVNRKKSEIQTIANIVKAAVAASYGVITDSKKISFTIYCEEGFCWEVFSRSDKLFIELWSALNGPRLYSSSDGVSASDVDRVHVRLGALVEGLQKKISDFNHHISPYVFAERS